VPRAGGDLLSKHHQQVITNMRAPRTVRIGRVVLRGRDEVQSRRSGADREFLGRQLAI
jgi:hypothetical protein